eukprot:CAMPEP_0183732958 /NCGR_PEP_ID=MMETSP0737-20130205/39809_1 /TAXON_ID=385413 /ORGANISM="Thalassiosira miniscula, Strain CCMP1093" /LENGTH=561 /DNA_ID=CAMNT_0025966113 /DNA_START=85 /DNA_END=1766 /DNA_ORIENTATION=-
MAPSSAHRQMRQRQRLPSSPRNPKSGSKIKANAIGIFVTAFSVSSLALWLCVVVISSWQSPQNNSRSTVPTQRLFFRQPKGRGRGGHEERSLQYNHHRSGSTTGRNSRKPRVVGIYAYQLNEHDDWKDEKDNNFFSYMYLAERLDPYLLSHTPQTLRRVRHHDYYPNDTPLSEIVHNYKLAIAGSNSHIKSEDPLKHLMLSASSRKALRDIRDGSDDYEEGLAEPLEDEECEATPKNAQWMLHSFPTCNSLHENDWVTGVRKSKTKILGSGYWRDVWPVLDSEPSTLSWEKKVALKTIRYEHDYSERNFHRHIRDAIVSERLTSSPRVTEIYAFCGNSGYFQFASGGSLNDRLEEHYMAKYENLGRKEGGENDDDAVALDQRSKLDLAYQVAAALADFHDVDAMRNGDGEIISAAIVHADITADQFVFIDGAFKLNDFNRCRFMRRYRNSTNLGGDGKPCGFYVGNNPAKNRAPEEYAYDIETEKIDIYSMGNIFYSLLTDKDPWEETSTNKAQKNVMKGKRPEVPASIKTSKNPVDVALRKVMWRCWQHKPEDRPRARSV